MSIHWKHFLIRALTAQFFHQAGFHQLPECPLSYHRSLLMPGGDTPHLLEFPDTSQLTPNTSSSISKSKINSNQNSYGYCHSPSVFWHKPSLIMRIHAVHLDTTYHQSSLFFLFAVSLVCTEWTLSWLHQDFVSRHSILLVIISMSSCCCYLFVCVW